MYLIPSASVCWMICSNYGSDCESLRIEGWRDGENMATAVYRRAINQLSQGKSLIQ